LPVKPSVTNDLGGYRLYGLAPGRYRVCAGVDRPAPAADGSILARTCHIAATAESEASDVVLGAEDASGIDIRVQRVGSFAISGAVIDANGMAVDKGFVHAAPLDAHRLSAQAVTQAGQFVIKGLTAGRYLLTASVGGGAPGDPNPPAREREVGHAEVVVQGADATGASIALAKLVTLSGGVIFEGSPAPSPRKLELVVHTGYAESRMYFDSMPPRASVGDDLRFELAGLDRLPRLVSIRNLPEGWALKEVRLDRRDITSLPADLWAGKRLEIIVTNQVGKLSVRVLPGEKGPSAFHLVLFPADPAKWRGGWQAIPGTSTRDGVVSLGARIAGEYLVAALPAEDVMTIARDPGRLAQLALVATRLAVSAGDTRTIDLPIVSLPPQR